MKTKAERQAALLRLAHRRALPNQEQMVRLLQQQGFHATQSSVSRDVRELGLVRLNGRYLPASEVADGESPVSHPSRHELSISMQPVGANLIVTRTTPAAAPAIAAEIDQCAQPDVSGTIAGDDTIFIAVPSRAAQGRVLNWLRRRFTATTRPSPSPSSN